MFNSAHCSIFEFVLCGFLPSYLMALVLNPSLRFNTGTDVVESLRGPLVPLVQQQGLGAAGEDFSNQFYCSYAIGLTQQGQAQQHSSANVCVCARTQGESLYAYTPRQ